MSITKRSYWRRNSSKPVTDFLIPSKSVNLICVIKRLYNERGVAFLVSPKTSHKSLTNETIAVNALIYVSFESFLD